MTLENPKWEICQVRKGLCKDCKSEIISEVHYYWQIQEQIEWCNNCEKHTTKTKFLEAAN